MTEKETTRGRVLVVDDDEAARESLQAVLELECEVLTAANTTEADEALQRAQVDVVVTDHDMPGRTGLEWLGAMRRSHPAVMVILLTGHPDIADFKNAERSQEVVRVMRKPYDPKRLVQLVRNTVKLSRTGRALAK